MVIIMSVNEKIESNNREEKERIKKNTRKASFDIFLSYMPYIIIIVFICIIRFFVATPVSVNGSSMYPTLKNDDYMILYKLTKKMRGINRFDIVVINTDSGRIIKRVIGLPGEKIKYEIEKNDDGDEVGALYINGKKVKEDFIDDIAKRNTCNDDWIICKGEYIIPEGEYFVMGDNRVNSIDSRVIGTVKDKDIQGIARLRIFPFNKFGNVY